MIDHYRKRFKHIDIYIYDQSSTDGTPELARALGCNVIHQDGDEIRDDTLQWFKNNIWKNYPAGWVIVCDADEFLEVCDEDVKDFSKIAAVQARGYDMIGDTMNLDAITEGVRNPMYDKFLMFDTRKTGMVYQVGAHLASPAASVEIARGFKLYHMRYPKLDYVIERYKMYSKRLSDINNRNGWCANYNLSEEKIRAHFEQLWNKKQKVR